MSQASALQAPVLSRANHGKPRYFRIDWTHSGKLFSPAREREFAVLIMGLKKSGSASTTLPLSSCIFFVGNCLAFKGAIDDNFTVSHHLTAFCKDVLKVEVFIKKECVGASAFADTALITQAV